MTLAHIRHCSRCLTGQHPLGVPGARTSRSALHQPHRRVIPVGIWRIGCGVAIGLTMTFTDIDLSDDLSSNPIPSGIADDERVACHGTSLTYAMRIESDGLGYAQGMPPFWADVQGFMAFREVSV